MALSMHRDRDDGGPTRSKNPQVVRMVLTSETVAAVIIEHVNRSLDQRSKLERSEARLARYKTHLSNGTVPKSMEAPAILHFPMEDKHPELVAQTTRKLAEMRQTYHTGILTALRELDSANIAYQRRERKQEHSELRREVLKVVTPVCSTDQATAVVDAAVDAFDNSCTIATLNGGGKLTKEMFTYIILGTTTPQMTTATATHAGAASSSSAPADDKVQAPNETRGGQAALPKSTKGKGKTAEKTRGGWRGRGRGRGKGRGGRGGRVSAAQKKPKA